MLTLVLCFCFVESPFQKDQIRFKLKSYSRIDINENEGEGLKVAVRDVRAGTVFLIYFRISRNYFTLKPGEIYHYDATKAYVSPSFSIPAEPAVVPAAKLFACRDARRAR